MFCRFVEIHLSCTEVVSLSVCACVCDFGFVCTFRSVEICSLIGDPLEARFSLHCSHIVELDTRLALQLDIHVFHY